MLWQNQECLLPKTTSETELCPVKFVVLTQRSFSDDKHEYNPESSTVSLGRINVASSFVEFSETFILMLLPFLKRYV